MTPGALIHGHFSGAQILSAANLEEHWYAAYTSANHEKRVAEQLDLRAVKHFLPLYKTVRRWKDRQVRLEKPLFPGYVFVRLALVNRLSVLQIPSVARLVGFNGQPSVVPDAEIEAVKSCVACGMQAEPYPYLNVGRRARITAGALAGYEGVLVRYKGHYRVVLSIESVTQSIAVEVDASMLAPIREPGNQ